MNSSEDVIRVRDQRLEPAHRLRLTRMPLFRAPLQFSAAVRPHATRGEFCLTVTTSSAMPATDSRFSLDERFGEESAAESSTQALEREEASDSHHSDPGDGEQSENEQNDALGEGMDPSGFAGPKVVKPLTPEALAAFQAAQNRAGVIYISRIPPGMRPMKVRHLMSQYGDVGRVYLQQEGPSIIYLEFSVYAEIGCYRC